MAEKLKTFVDTTWTLSDVDKSTNKLTLFTNKDVAQAVVKDIQVNMSKAIKGTINAGNCVISDEITTLSGSAIVDKNEGMSIEIPVPFGINISRSAPSIACSKGHYATNTTSITEGFLEVVQTPSVTTITGTTLTEAEVISKYETVLNVSSFSNTIPSFPIEVATVPVATMSQPAWVYRHSDTVLYYFQYDGNATTHLYVSTNNGTTWALLNNHSSAYKCINPDGRISWINGTAYNFVNPGATSISGTVQLSGRITSNYGTSSYSRASECNGWHFWCPESRYTTILYGYHQDKNIAVTITLNSAMNLSSNGGLCVSYNSTEKKYFLLSTQSTSRMLHMINTDIDSLVADGTGTGVLLTSGLGINHHSNYNTTTQWVPGTKDIIFIDATTNKPMRTTLSMTSPYRSTPKLALDTAIIGGVVNYVDGVTWTGTGQEIDVYADHLDTIATIQVRATGVEITE